MNLDKKTLILVRHAHRDTSQKEKDNSLSEKGLKQAGLLLKKFEKIHLLDKNTALFSSPKKRCIETLEEIAEASEAKIKIDPLLVEQENQESITQFKSRIQKFIDNWIQSEESLTLVCSHGDWLPIALELLLGVSSDFDKGGWAEIVLVRRKPMLRFRN